MDYFTKHNCSCIALVCKFIFGLSLALKNITIIMSITAVAYFLTLKYMQKHHVSKINNILMIPTTILSYWRSHFYRSVVLQLRTAEILYIVTTATAVVLQNCYHDYHWGTDAIGNTVMSTWNMVNTTTTVVLLQNCYHGYHHNTDRGWGYHCSAGSDGQNSHIRYQPPPYNPQTFSNTHTPLSLTHTHPHPDQSGGTEWSWYDWWSLLE